MAVINRIAGFHADLTAWRRDLHAHPEIAFEEHRTSTVVAEKLASFGVEVHRGLAGTGVVGVLKAGSGRRTIALRADMDALPLQEKTGASHASTAPGRMHACGHDGHTTMLLGAARYLAETKNFDGTVYFIFQPAEENEGGGRVMVEQGLFEKFPADAVYGMHNWPGLDVGRFAIRPGPMMASFDIFEATITGKGGHGAMPHLAVDPILVASQAVTALQSIASRNTDPMEAVVVTVTQMHAGDAYNIIPDEVVLKGTTRSFRPEVQDRIEPLMRRILHGVAAAFGASAELRYERRYPPTINAERQTEAAARVAASLAGEDNLVRDPTPSMGAEDFAFMLQEKPGAYIFIGNGPADDGRLLHNPRYDFNDEALPWGASYWSRLVETELAKAG